MRLYPFTVFLSAFLLFQVQPLIAKSILPWFGGTPSVWTTCMLFFQLMLLAGYCYAHFVVRRLSQRRQGVLHVALLFISLMLLPIIPGSFWKPTDGSDPTLRILALLLATVGGPYFLLSATAPLLQSWYHHAYRRSPFRLYAVSNAASLLALLTYPPFVERLLRSQTQAWMWSIAYVVFSVVCGILALRLRNSSAAGGPEYLDTQFESMTEGALPRGRAPTVIDVVVWLCLATCGSVMLLATTNQLCQDVASVPFLWVLPLGLYLLSFVICFDAEHWYHRSAFNVMLIIGVLAASVAVVRPDLFSLTGTIAAFSFALFVCCITCHGELARLKPDPSHLTMFYLMVALGGATGGILVTLVAPAIFDRFIEFPVALAATCVLAIFGKRYERHRDEFSVAKWSQWIGACAVGLAAIVILTLVVDRPSDDPGNPRQDGTLQRRRNFYGALRVRREGGTDPDLDRISMSHGTTLHGYQFQAEGRRDVPTTYFVRESGVGLALDDHPRRQAGATLRVGVVGLGCGTLSAYMNEGDYLRFYEINPDVLALARQYFTFEQDAVARGADVDVYMGDARIVMERQIQQGQLQNLDVLVVDAFSSDAIPVHLLTKECFEIYWRHLKPEGILAVHITNRYLDLSPVVRTLAEDTAKAVRIIRLTDSAQHKLSEQSLWVLVTNNPRFLNDETIRSASEPETPLRRVEWTDSFSNLFSVLKK